VSEIKPQQRRRRRRARITPVGAISLWYASVAVAHIVLTDHSYLDSHGLSPTERRRIETELLHISDLLEEAACLPPA
jgi:hypothetical protein